MPPGACPIADSNGNYCIKALTVSPANCPGGVSCSVGLNYFQRPPVSQQQPDTQWMYRIDFIPVSSDTFTFRYMHDRNSYTPYLGLNSSGLPGFDAQEGGPTELGQGTWTHSVHPPSAERVPGIGGAAEYAVRANSADCR